MSTVQWEGVLTHVDEDGNEQQMLPHIKTDKSLTISGKAADAAIVGAKMKNLENKTFEPIEILQADYDLLSEEEKASGVYIITDAEINANSAASITYDGSETGLGNTVQAAIDVLYSKKPFTKTYRATIGNINAGADFYMNDTVIETFNGFTPIIVSWSTQATQYQTWLNLVEVRLNATAKIIITGRNDGSGTATNAYVDCVVLYIPS